MVLDDVIVTVPVPALTQKDIVIRFVSVPRVIVLSVDELSVNFIVALPVVVKFVGVEVVHTVPVPVIDQVPDPVASVLVFEFVELKAPILKVLSFALNVPSVRVRVLVVPIVKLSARETVEVLFIVIALFTVTPLVVIVCVPELAANVNVPPEFMV